MLLNDVLKEFLFEIKIRNYTPKTQKEYKNNNALFHTCLKNEYSILELEEVTHQAVCNISSAKGQKTNLCKWVKAVI